MKKMLILAVAAICGLHAFGQSSTGATTNWVAKYVATYVSNALSNSSAQAAMDAKIETSEGGKTSITAGSGDFQLTATFELPVNQCLTASECTEIATSKGIANGSKWVKVGNKYVGQGLPDITEASGIWHCSIFSSKDVTTTEFYANDTLAFKTESSFVTETKANEIKGED